jgi:hypothetical protein
LIDYVVLIKKLKTFCADCVTNEYEISEISIILTIVF